MLYANLRPVLWRVIWSGWGRGFVLRSFFYVIQSGLESAIFLLFVCFLNTDSKDTDNCAQNILLLFFSIIND